MHVFDCMVTCVVSAELSIIHELLAKALPTHTRTRASLVAFVFMAFKLQGNVLPDRQALYNLLSCQFQAAITVVSSLRNKAVKEWKAWHIYGLKKDARTQLSGTIATLGNCQMCIG
jgi:hypothetical protein